MNPEPSNGGARNAGIIYTLSTREYYVQFI